MRIALAILGLLFTVSTTLYVHARTQMSAKASVESVSAVDDRIATMSSAIDRRLAFADAKEVADQQWKERTSRELGEIQATLEAIKDRID